MRVDGNNGALPGYVPNSLDEWADSPHLAEPPLPLGTTARHWDHRADDDYYSQPRALFRLLSPEERQRLFDNTARSLTGTTEAVKQRHVRNCALADPEYGEGVAKALER